MISRRGAEPTYSFVMAESAGDRTAVLCGDWTGVDARGTGARLLEAMGETGRWRFDLTQVQRVDTAGALSILRAARDRVDPDAIAAKPEIRRLLDLVRSARRSPTPLLHAEGARASPLTDLGRRAILLVRDFAGTLNFIGRLTLSLVRTAADPRRIRWAAWASHAETAGLDAIPIVALTSLFIGMVVAMLGIHMLQQFGARVFAVQLTGVAILREFGVVITAVILAGRSASAFAAELGSMRMRREIDAMTILAVDPAEALVLPRLAALLVTMPLLCVVADLSGLVGGMLATWLAIGLSPDGFLARMQHDVGVGHFWVGLSKTPIMAAVIACIGCHQGLRTGGDAESLGRRVTAAVVHAIFAIIMIDAAFAVAYLGLNI